METVIKISISSGQAGLRLYRLVAEKFPSLGTRGAKRLVENGFVSINEKKAKPLQKISSGDELIITMPSLDDAPGVSIICEEKDFVFLNKPSHLHSVSLAGDAAFSVESYLHGMKIAAEKRRNCCLAQRLDYGTSGIIVAANDKHALREFHDAEDDGRCEKFYLAILDGRLASHLVVKNALDARKRVKSKVLNNDAPPLRHTEITPLFYIENEIPNKLQGFFQNNGCLDKEFKCMTVAGCRIKKGARHQIRAHAAAIGHPLVGDGLYNDSFQEKNNFFLHQAMIKFNRYICKIFPVWLPEEYLYKAECWLNAGI